MPQTSKAEDPSSGNLALVQAAIERDKRVLIFGFWVIALSRGFGLTLAGVRLKR